MANYVTVPLVTDPATILTSMIADYAARMPGWIPYQGSPEVTLMSVVALRHATRLDVDSQVFDSIYLYSGTTIDGVPFNDATFATIDSTWTFTGTAGYTVDPGLRVTIPIDGSTSAEFVTVGTTIVPPSNSTWTIPLQASVAGAASSGLSGTPTLEDARTWVVSVALIDETVGGQDAEAIPDYLNRVTAKRQLSTDTIVAALDAQQTLLLIPGIGRVLILDNHVPPIGMAGAMDGVPGAVTAVICAPDGSDTDSGIKTTALATLNATRLLELSAYVVDPIRTNVSVTFDYDVYTGWDPTAVGATAGAAITNYANPAGWGAASTAGGAQDWDDDLLFRYSEVYAAGNSAQGLNHISNVRINGSLDTDATLAGPGALPNLTSVVGTYVP